MLLTRAQLNKIDRQCVAAGVSIETLMENAGAAVAGQAIKMLSPGDGVTVICGHGNNGGDGFVAARLLHQRGYIVQVLFEPADDKWSDATMASAEKLHKAQVPASAISRGAILESTPALFIDGLRGTAVDSAPRECVARLIDALNATARLSGRPILSIDVPSGLDCDTGAVPGAAVSATCTVTFVASKMGFAKPNAAAFTGNVVVADIGVPHEIVDRVIAQSG